MESIDRIVEDAIRKAIEDSPAIIAVMDKSSILEWANRSADALLAEAKGEVPPPDQAVVNFSGKTVLIEGPLRVVPDDKTEPYYITHVIQQYDEDGVIRYVEEGTKLDDYEDFFDEDDSDDLAIVDDDTDI